MEVTYEQQANAMNVWHIAKYNTTAMQEGDALDDGRANWNGGGDVTYYDLPASEVGGKVVELAMSRWGILIRRPTEEKIIMWIVVT